MAHWKYFPQPLFSHINEDGEITMEWIIHKNGKEVKRGSIHIENDNDIEKTGELHAYGIMTEIKEDGTFNQPFCVIKKSEDIVKFLKEQLDFEPEE